MRPVGAAGQAVGDHLGQRIRPHGLDGGDPGRRVGVLQQVGHRGAGLGDIDQHVATQLHQAWTAERWVEQPPKQAGMVEIARQDIVRCHDVSGPGRPGDDVGAGYWQLGTMMEAFDVVIIGAGAAGLMCAISAGRRGRRVLVLDHADSPGKKILISGGGRCNFTNREVRAENFLSGNRHFARSALARYRPEDFIALLQRHGIAWHEKTLGQLFCDGSARQVVAMLLAECEAAGVTLRCNCPVTDIGRSDRFRIETASGSVTASSLVLATGGLSIPKMGATGFAHEVAARFDLALTPIRPALVPLTFGGEDGAVMHALSGVALPVAATYGRTRFKEALLFTHRGLSGPAILQISSYWREGEPIALELLPDATRLLLERKRARPRAEARTVLGELLPTRLAQALAERHLPVAGDRQHPRPSAASARRPARRVAADPERHRGLCQGGGDRRRHRHHRPVVAHHGVHHGARPVRPSARRSTSPAGSAAIISSGPGPAAGSPARRHRGGRWPPPCRARIEIRSMAETAMMRKYILMAACAVACLTHQAVAAPQSDSFLQHAVDAPTRTDKFKARDAARHPVQELAFFGVRPRSTVVEIWPGGGYWTQILAPALYAHGTYYAAFGGPDGDKDEAHFAMSPAFRQMLDQHPEIYGRVKPTVFGAHHPELAPPGSAGLRADLPQPAQLDGRRRRPETARGNPSCPEGPAACSASRSIAATPARRRIRRPKAAMCGRIMRRP